MTVGKELTSRAGRWRSLPPTRVGKKLSCLLGLQSRTNGLTRKALGFLTHLGVGAISGIVYRSARALVTATAAAPPTADYAAGIAFGTGVWACGYVGVLPALGLVEPPHRAPRGQTLTMLIAHWVYGTSLTALARR